MAATMPLEVVSRRMQVSASTLASPLVARRSHVIICSAPSYTPRSAAQPNFRVRNKPMRCGCIPVCVQLCRVGEVLTLADRRAVCACVDPGVARLPGEVQEHGKCLPGHHSGGGTPSPVARVPLQLHEGKPASSLISVKPSLLRCRHLYGAASVWLMCCAHLVTVPPQFSAL